MGHCDSKVCPRRNALNHATKLLRVVTLALLTLGARPETLANSFFQREIILGNCLKRVSQSECHVSKSIASILLRGICGVW